MIEPMIYAGLPAEKQTKISKNSDLVFEVVQKTMGYSKADLIGKGRNTLLVDSRIFFSWILRNRLKCTFSQIGNQLKRDHTTIMYYFEVFDMRLQNEPIFRRNHEAVLAEFVRRF